MVLLDIPLFNPKMIMWASRYGIQLLTGAWAVRAGGWWIEKSTGWVCVELAFKGSLPWENLELLSACGNQQWRRVVFQIRRLRV